MQPKVLSAGNEGFNPASSRPAAENTSELAAVTNPLAMWMLVIVAEAV